MSSQPVDRSHPVACFAARAGQRLAELAGLPVWSMAPGEQRAALADLAAARAQLDALYLRVLAEAERSGATAADGSASAADWVAVTTRQTRHAARADLRLATALETHHELSDALDAGKVNTAQARAIVGALDRLPTSGEHAVSLEQAEAAEAHLVGLAAHHDAEELAVLGRRVFEVIAPEVADEIDGKILQAQEAAALRRTSFTMRQDDQGTVHGRFRIPALHGQMLHKMLLALDQPTTDPAAEPRHPGPVARGLAFCDLIERIPAQRLPAKGGCSATVVVTITLEQLLSGLGAAGIDTGGHLSAAAARRLACTAGIIPAVLGGASQVLDLGRRRRFHTPAQRIALHLEQHGCTRRRLRPAARALPRPPRHPLVGRRRHQRRQRPAALWPPPPPHPRPRLHPRHHSDRPGHLPPAYLSTPGPTPTSAEVSQGSCGGPEDREWRCSPYSAKGVEPGSTRHP